MPCDNPAHSHASWPIAGAHRLTIASCETECGWCNYRNSKANNLRVHARRHTVNPLEDTLKDVVIVPCKAGRGRVTTNLSLGSVESKKPTELAYAKSGSENQITPSDIGNGLSDVHTLYKSAVEECLALRAKNALLEKRLLEHGIDSQVEIRTFSTDMLSTRASPTISDISRTQSPYHSELAEGPSINVKEQEWNKVLGTNKLLKLKAIALHEVFYYLKSKLKENSVEVPGSIIDLQRNCCLRPVDTLVVEYKEDGRRYILRGSRAELIPSERHPKYKGTSERRRFDLGDILEDLSSYNPEMVNESGYFHNPDVLQENAASVDEHASLPKPTKSFTNVEHGVSQHTISDEEFQIRMSTLEDLYGFGDVGYAASQSGQVNSGNKISGTSRTQSSQPQSFTHSATQHSTQSINIQATPSMITPGTEHQESSLAKMGVDFHALPYNAHSPHFPGYLKESNTTTRSLDAIHEGMDDFSASHSGISESLAHESLQCLISYLQAWVQVHPTQRYPLGFLAALEKSFQPSYGTVRRHPQGYHHHADACSGLETLISYLRVKYNEQFDESAYHVLVDLDRVRQDLLSEMPH